MEMGLLEVYTVISSAAEYVRERQNSWIQTGGKCGHWKCLIQTLVMHTYRINPGYTNIYWKKVLYIFHMISTLLLVLYIQ